jgi:hypothetical protein
VFLRLLACVGVPASRDVVKGYDRLEGKCQWPHPLF